MEDSIGYYILLDGGSYGIIYPTRYWVLLDPRTYWLLDTVSYLDPRTYWIMDTASYRIQDHTGSGIILDLELYRIVLEPGSWMLDSRYRIVLDSG